PLSLLSDQQEIPHPLPLANPLSHPRATRPSHIRRHQTGPLQERQARPPRLFSYTTPDNLFVPKPKVQQNRSLISLCINLDS
ncbi:hypothetical protein BGZ81_002102, partial [Podila clonocystis]